MTNPLDIRTEVIQVRLSPREKSAAKRRQKKHETLSEYIRRLINKDGIPARRRRPEISA